MDICETGQEKGRSQFRLLFRSGCFFLNKISHVKDYGDVSNAFGSPSFVSLEWAVCQIVQPRDVPIAKQRFFSAVFVMETATGVLALHPRQGGLAGDPFMVVVFRIMHNAPMDEWGQAVRSQQSHEQKVALTARWDGEMVDLSVTRYADDTVRTLIPYFPTCRGSADKKI